MISCFSSVSLTVLIISCHVWFFCSHLVVNRLLLTTFFSFFHLVFPFIYYAFSLFTHSPSACSTLRLSICSRVFCVFCVSCVFLCVLVCSCCVLVTCAHLFTSHRSGSGRHYHHLRESFKDPHSVTSSTAMDGKPRFVHDPGEGGAFRPPPPHQSRGGWPVADTNRGGKFLHYECVALKESVAQYTNIYVSRLINNARRLLLRVIDNETIIESRVTFLFYVFLSDDLSKRRASCFGWISTNLSSAQQRPADLHHESKRRTRIRRYPFTLCQ